MVRTIAKDHDAKRQRILDVAASVFAREGIARASMNEVARACGISKANIYHYYASKDDLLFDILDSYLSELRDRTCGLDLTSAAPPDCLRLICQEFLLAYEGMDHEHKIQTEGLPLLAVDKQEVLRGYQRDLVGRVSTILTDCAPKALAQDKARRRELTMSVFGMLNWFYMWKPRADRASRLSYGDRVATLMLEGLRGFEGDDA